MSKAILYDGTVCIGCKLCEKACAERNSLSYDDNVAAEEALSAHKFTFVMTKGDKFMRRLCMNCEDPSCASVCPVGALRKTKKGPVTYEESRCIGCRYCMVACPFSVPKYEWGKLLPRVRKCDMCADRLAAGRPTACAEACPTGATKFGERDELIAEAKDRIAKAPSQYVNHIYGLEEVGGTSVLLLSSVPFESFGFRAPTEPMPMLTYRVLSHIPDIVTLGGTLLGGVWWITSRRTAVAASEGKENGGKKKGATMKLPKLTFWKAVMVVLFLSGGYATLLRFTRGLGATTNLSDSFPWGLWIGFDILCGVMLAAGGFTLTATVYIFNIERFRPIIRPAVLTAFLGYVLVVVALLFDLGRPYRIWHPLVMWNPRSVMFEVAWCVTLYTAVLALEFSPFVFERLRMAKLLRIQHAISIPLVILGVLLSTLHQSSLGSLYLIMPGKLHPLWYSPLLPVFFFISAICVGLAMTIFESYMSAKAFGKQLELPLLISLGRILMVGLAVYGVLRFQDLYHRGALKYLRHPGYEADLFLLEVGLGLLLPIGLLMNRRVRESASGLYGAAVLVVLGFIANRLNVSVTGMEASAGVHYIPKWTEIAVTASIVAAGFATFGLAAKYLPIFPEGPLMPGVAPPEAARPEPAAVGFTHVRA